MSVRERMTIAILQTHDVLNMTQPNKERAFL